MDPANRDQARLDEEYAELLHGDEPDAVGETVAEYSERNPRFPALMEDACSRRRLLRELAAMRAQARLTQEDVARLMETSQPHVARMEAGNVDPRLSTVQRYAASIGKRLLWQLVDA
jgi:DNA-binding XRE family transcriptional regulator